MTPGIPLPVPQLRAPRTPRIRKAFKARAGRRAPCTVEPAARHPHIPRLIIHPVRSDLDEGQETRRDARRAAPTTGLFEGGANALTSRSIDKNKRPRGPSRSGRKLLMDAERLGSSRPCRPAHRVNGFADREPAGDRQLNSTLMHRPLARQHRDGGKANSCEVCSPTTALASVNTLNSCRSGP